MLTTTLEWSGRKSKRVAVESSSESDDEIHEGDTEDQSKKQPIDEEEAVAVLGPLESVGTTTGRKGVAVKLTKPKPNKKKEDSKGTQTLQQLFARKK